MKKYCCIAVILFGLLPALCSAEIVRTTAYGQGADTYLSNDSQQSPDSNMGTEVRMRAWRQLADTRSKIGYIRFDISEVVGSMKDAYLTLAYTYMKGGASTITVYGVIDGPDDFWIESGTGGITYNTAPGLLPTTLGNYLIDNTKAVQLGTFVSSDIQTLPYSVSTNPATLDLEAFLKADTNGLVTFFFIGPNDEDEIATKENTTYHAPMLVMPHAVEGGAANPSPAAGSTITDLNLSQLCWENYSIQRATLWFGKADANEVNYQTLLTPLVTLDVDGEGETTCYPIPAEHQPLDVPATYTWAIEGYAYPPEDPNHYGEPNLFLATVIWQFHTSAIPIIKVNPTDQYKFAGETATFSTTVESLTELTNVTWYRDDQLVNIMDYPRIDFAINDLGGNLYQTTLTINNVGLADEGAYTCVIENAGGASDPTGIGHLVVKRKLAQWDFDGSAADATGVYNGTLFGEPNFVVDGIHQAMEFDGVNDYVQLPAGFANFRSGLTFTVWAKPAAIANWARFFDFGNGAGVNNVFVTRNGTSTNLTFNTYNGSVTANGVLDLNEWQFFAVTMTEAGAVTIYKDGFAVQTGTLGVPTVVVRGLNYIGESNWESDSLYAGLMDDMRIYNYALDVDTLADMYTAINGPYCRFRPVLDRSGSCVVDLADFAEVAAAWLECGLWPVSACDNL